MGLANELIAYKTEELNSEGLSSDEQEEILEKIEEVGDRLVNLTKTDKAKILIDYFYPNGNNILYLQNVIKNSNNNQA